MPDAPDLHPVYFGVDVEALMREWFYATFVPAVIADYGDSPFAVVVLSNRVRHDWTNPFKSGSVLLRFAYGSEEKVNGEEGLYANVERKLRFVLRTGLDSSWSETHPHLLEPGDFPYRGAGTANDFVGGVSGFSQDQDWAVFERFTSAFTDVRESAAMNAVAECIARVPGMKYLGGTPATPRAFRPD
jgi:hypothetical protein